MVNEIGPAGQNHPEGVVQGNKGCSQDVSQGSSNPTSPEAHETELSSNLQQILDRVSCETPVRAERVQEVTEKMKQGELVTPDTIRNAAANLLSREL